MKYDLDALPAMHRARIKSTKTLLAACRSQLRSPDPDANLAYAEHAHLLQSQLERLEESALTLAPHRRDRFEASAAAGKGGGR